MARNHYAPVRLAGVNLVSNPVDALHVGSLAIHRPVNYARPGEHDELSSHGWAVTHVASGFSLSQHVWSSLRAKRPKLVAWAEAAQAHDPEVWEIADRTYCFGDTSRVDPALVERLKACIDAANRAGVAGAK